MSEADRRTSDSEAESRGVPGNACHPWIALREEVVVLVGPPTRCARWEHESVRMDGDLLADAPEDDAALVRNEHLVKIAR